MSKDDFSTFEVSKIFGVQYQTLRDWLDRGFLRPKVQAKGRSTRTRFSRVDLYLLQLFIHLLERGFHRNVAATIIERARPLNKQLAEEILESLYIYIWSSFEHPDDVTIGFHPKTRGPKIELSLSDAKKSYDEVLVVNFAKIRKDVDALLA